MPDLRSRLKTIPEGAAALFFIQIFATLGFAVLYSTLVLYATRHLHFSAKEASAIMGVFGAFNYGLHLFGGYLGGRFLSNRNLFVGGMLLQVLGCGTMSVGTVDDDVPGPGAVPHRQRPQRHLHQHDADAALRAGRPAPRKRVLLELRRHEHGVLHRLRGRGSLPADRELLAAVPVRDRRQLPRHRARALQLEDAGGQEHAAAGRHATAIQGEVRRGHRHPDRARAHRLVHAAAHWPDRHDLQDIFGRAGRRARLPDDEAQGQRANGTTCGRT